jgi:RNA polymerase sigma-70 factor (ECF subfamily)
MAHGPAKALPVIDSLLAAGDLADYYLLHAARADMFRRLGEMKSAAESYSRALEIVTNESERRFLERRLREVTG